MKTRPRRSGLERHTVSVHVKGWFVIVQMWKCNASGSIKKKKSRSMIKTVCNIASAPRTSHKLSKTLLLYKWEPNMRLSSAANLRALWLWYVHRVHRKILPTFNSMTFVEKNCLICNFDFKKMAVLPPSVGMIATTKAETSSWGATARYMSLVNWRTKSNIHSKT